MKKICEKCGKLAFLLKNNLIKGKPDICHKCAFEYYSKQFPDATTEDTYNHSVACLGEICHILFEDIQNLKENFTHPMLVTRCDGSTDTYNEPNVVGTKPSDKPKPPVKPTPPPPPPITAKGRKSREEKIALLKQEIAELEEEILISIPPPKPSESAYKPGLSDPGGDPPIIQTEVDVWNAWKQNQEEKEEKIEGLKEELAILEAPMPAGRLIKEGERAVPDYLKDLETSVAGKESKIHYKGKPIGVAKCFRVEYNNEEQPIGVTAKFTIDEGNQDLIDELRGK